MKCSKGSWIFVLLVLLCFLVIPIRIVYRYQVPSKYADQLFRQFSKQFNKTYGSSAEFQKRYNIFAKNLDDSVKKNAATNSAAQFGVNRFSDLSAEEFSAMHLNRNLSQFVKIRLDSVRENQSQRNLSSLLNVTDFEYSFTDNNRFDRYPMFYNVTLLRKNLNFVPLRVDWRNDNVLQKVRLQGTCGICWAFSVIEMMEAHLAIHRNIKRKLSVQQMVDCARNGNDGCNGGDNCLLLEWLIKERINIRTDDEYPVSTRGELQACKVSANDSVSGLDTFRATNFTCNSFVGNENALLEVLANYGPVSVALNAAPWQSYVSGIIKDECAGGEEDINHAVLIVGYDRTTDIPYYIVQNSWGEEFAENGFVKIAFGNNTCGIASQVSLVLVK